MRRAAGRHLREIAETIILALLIFLVVRAVVQNFQVEGSSMEPTLESSWYLLVNKAAYWEVNLETMSKFIAVRRGRRRSDPLHLRRPANVAT